MKTEKHLNNLNKIESKVSKMTVDELELFATETNDTLQALMDELKKRKHKRMHAEVDHLEDYIGTAQSNFSSLKDFIAMAIKEIKGH